MFTQSAQRIQEAWHMLIRFYKTSGVEEFFDFVNQHKTLQNISKRVYSIQLSGDKQKEKFRLISFDAVLKESVKEFDVDKNVETERTYYTRERISVAWLYEYQTFGAVVGRKEMLNVAEDILEYILHKKLHKSYRQSVFTTESINNLYKRILNVFTEKGLSGYDAGLRDVILLGATVPTDTLQRIVTYGRSLHKSDIVRDLINAFRRLGVVGIIFEFKGVRHRIYIHENGMISTATRLEEIDFVDLVLKVLGLFGLDLS